MFPYLYEPMIQKFNGRKSWKKVKDFFVNDTHSEKLCFTQLVVEEFTEIEVWLVLTFFHMLTQLIKLFTFHCHILKSTDVWKRCFVKQTVKMDGFYFQQILP